MHDLGSTQRRIWRWLTAPSGVRAALAEEGDPDGVGLAVLLRGDARCSAIARLEIYANAYFQRVHDALAEDYAALAAALGAGWFNDLVTAYLLAHPPAHPSLRFAGSELASFLDAAPGGAPFRRRFPFAADLARLEWALSFAFDAADAEPLRREDLAAVPLAEWEQLALALHPSVRTLRLGWPVAALREAFDADAVPLHAPASPGPCAVVVWRRVERVFFRSAEPLELELLEALRAGARFGALCERAAREVGEAEAPARAAGWLAAWVGTGLLVRPEPDGNAVGTDGPRPRASARPQPEQARSTSR
jgi:hypothetical protein